MTGKAKVTEHQIQCIRDLRAAGESWGVIGSTLGLATQTVRYHGDDEYRRASNARCKVYHQVNLDERRSYLRQKVHTSRFRILPEQYDRMLTIQGGGCAICGGVSPDGKALAVDHDHNCCAGRSTCGKCIRGLLCMKCNLRLGHGEALGEDFLSRRESEYLHTWRKRITRECPNPWDELHVS